MVTPFTVSFEDAHDGWIFDYEQALDDATRALANLEPPAITIAIREDLPTITDVNKDLIKEEVTTLLQTARWRFTHEGNAWTLRTTDIAKSLELQQRNDAVTVGINRQVFDSLLERPRAALWKKSHEMQNLKLKTNA